MQETELETLVLSALLATMQTCMQVYLHRDGQQLGPYGIDQLRQCLEAGQLSPQDQACHDGATWIPLGKVPGLEQESPAPAGSKKKIFCLANLNQLMSLMLLQKFQV